MRGIAHPVGRSAICDVLAVCRLVMVITPSLRGEGEKEESPT